MVLPVLVLQMHNPNQLLLPESRRGERGGLVSECGPGTAEQNPPELCLFVKGSSSLCCTSAFWFIDTPTCGLFS